MKKLPWLLLAALFFTPACKKDRTTDVNPVSNKKTTGLLVNYAQGPATTETVLPNPTYVQPSALLDGQERKVFIASHLTLNFIQPGLVDFRKVLDVDESNPNTIGNVFSWEFNDGDNQLWWVRPVNTPNGRRYTIRSHRYNKFLNINGGGRTVLSNTPAYFTFGEGVTSAGLPYVYIYLAGTSNVLDVYQEETNDGTPVISYPIVYADNQRWSLVIR